MNTIHENQGSFIKLFIFLVFCSLALFGKDKENKIPVETFKGILQGTKGKVFLKRDSINAPYETFGISGSNTSIIIQTEDLKALKNFRMFFDKNWAKKNSSDYTKVKMRFCFEVKGTTFVNRGRTFIFPEGNIKFFTTKCKVKGPMNGKRFKLKKHSNLKLSKVVNPAQESSE